MKKKCFIYGTNSIKDNLRDKGVKLLNENEMEKAQIIKTQM